MTGPGCYASGFVARKFTPRVPKYATSLLGTAAPSNTFFFHVISKPWNPAATTVASSAASSSAPAIQLVHKSMSPFAPSGISFSTVMSAI